MNNNLENYSLLNNASGNNLNYNNNGYNNYQSWSNVGHGMIRISGVDESGNTQTSTQDFSRLQRLKNPWSTFGPVERVWVNNSKN